MRRIESIITPAEFTAREIKPPSSVTESQLSYEEFSGQPEYIDVNRSLIEISVSKLPDNFTHVDIATGTGLIPQLIIAEATKSYKKGNIIGIDPNITSLNIAKRNVLGSSGISVKFIEGYGQDLKKLLDGEILQEGVDGVSILDALHEIRSDEDKGNVIGSMTDILKPKGVLIFNSAFTTKGISPDPMGWGKWKLTAMAILGGKRNKQTTTMPIHSPETYRQMMENAGLVVIHEATKIVNLTKEALVAISRYPAFFRGTLEDMCGQEGISDVEKSNALIQALKDLNIPSLPRVWYEVIARKPATCPAVNPAIIFQR